MDESLKDDIRSLVYRIQLGGEAGRKLMLRTFLRALIAGTPEAGMHILTASIEEMPDADRQHVIAIIGEITDALAYKDG